MYTACVVIPIYKENPSELEIASFRQVLKVLNKYDIYIYTYQELNIKLYDDAAKQYGKSIKVEFFDKDYFSSITGYNKLCLSVDFYRRCCLYEYMLIYQLDAWVFRDELEYWCSLGYDYIGAPWFTNFGAYEDGEVLWKVGNGGFCLRRNSFFIKMLEYKWPITYNVEFGKGFLQFAKSILRCLGICNTIQYWISIKSETENEDFLLSNYFCFTKRKHLIPQMPTPHAAAMFSFEQSPTYLYGIIKKIPFGCHAFAKYEYETFWKPYIKL